MKKNLKYYIGIILFASLLYIPLTGRVHLFDWDEINFAESAREMIETGDYLTVQINYKPFWQKPPLYIWLQVLSMKIFGINEFAARFPNAVCGIFTLLILFHIGSKLKNQTFGLLWALSHGASILPFLYFKSGIIDPWFNLFIFLGIHQFILFYNSQKNLHITLSALFIGLAILTKGPAGLIIYGLTVIIYWLFKKFRLSVNFKQVLSFLLVLIIVGGFWFILMIMKGKMYLIKDFISYQVDLFTTEDAGHGGFFLYHFLVLLVGVFPASVFALKSLISLKEPYPSAMDYTLWMKILCWVVLILFSIVRTKIVHYSSMCYFPLSFLSASYLYAWIESPKKHPVYQNIAFYFLSSFFFLIAIALPLFGLMKNRLLSAGIIKDTLMLGNLQADIKWTGFEMLSTVFLAGGILLYFILMRKKKYLSSILSVFIGIALFTYAFLIGNIKKIEGYSQRAAIEFYISKQNENCYVKTISFKSYAQYFNTKEKKPDHQQFYNNEWMLKGDIDRTVYFVSRINRRGMIEKMAADDLVFIEEKNGFLFHKREPVPVKKP